MRSSKLIDHLEKEIAALRQTVRDREETITKLLRLHGVAPAPCAIEGGIPPSVSLSPQDRAQRRNEKESTALLKHGIEIRGIGR